MTDREFAKEAFEFIKAMVNTNEFYFLSKVGTKHYRELVSKYDDEKEGTKSEIMNLLRTITAPLEKIKGIANDKYVIDGKKYSKDEVVAKTLSRMIEVLEEELPEDDDEPESMVEFESADDVISKLFNGGNE